MLLDYTQEWKNNMWTHIVKSDNKLYQNGAEVKEIIIEGAVIDVVADSKDVVWLKIKEK